MRDPQKGAQVWVQMGKRKEAGIVLDTAFSSEGDYMQCKIELLVVNPLSPGGQQLLRQVYPHPIQSYRLTQRHEVLPGEAVVLP